MSVTVFLFLEEDPRAPLSSFSRRVFLCLSRGLSFLLHKEGAVHEGLLDGG